MNEHEQDFLFGSVFGELWKLEPLPEETKNRWRTEIEWLLAPTNYMVELVPAKQYGANGRALEASICSLPKLLQIIFMFSVNMLKCFILHLNSKQIMRPKARADVQMNIPALRKLDSLLLEVFVGQLRWWLPMPRVPVGGLSDGQRKRLLNQAKLVHQIFKAAKSINESILLEIPVPKIIGEALPESGKENLGDDLYRTLNTASSSAVGLFNSLNIKSEHSALDTINKLEAAIYSWKERISTQTTNTQFPARTLWSVKDPSMELNKIEFLINRAEVLLQQIRNRYPNLPQTFLDAMKIQYGKDIAYAIMEAYSRVLKNLAFNILTRIGDICREDVSVNPNSPMATNSLPEINVFGKMNLVNSEKGSYTPFLGDQTNTPSVTTMLDRMPRHCIGKEVCFTFPKMSF
ncbi:hypothetical protein R6Q57_016589 [Mikania cordata]